jgi:oxygen-dependent protoporphyrinogen oxidase
MLSAGSKLRLAKLFWDNPRIKPKLNYEDLSSCTAFDTETAAQYARRRGLGEQAFTYVIDATLRGVLGADAEKASVVDFFFAFNNLLGSTLYSLRGGLSRYPDALAQLFCIRTRARVVSVLDRGREVEVVWRDHSGTEHTEQVDGAIVRRVQLAGDYYSSTNLNTATTSGERAARELTHHLLVVG